jgi:hypothetical protein
MDRPNETSNLSADVSQAFFPVGIIFQQYVHASISNSDQDIHPPKVNVNGLDKFSHGTYATRPYYTFVKENTTGKRYLVSDGRLKAELILVPDSNGLRTREDGKYIQVAKYEVQIVRHSSAQDPSPGKTILSFNDPACGDLQGNLASFLILRTDSNGKDISESDLFPELPSGKNIFKAYISQTPTADESSTEAQGWGNAFRPRPSEPFYYLQQTWDVTKLKYLDYQSDGGTKKLFAEPGPESRNYTICTNGVSLPWGWQYDPLNGSMGGSETTMISSSQDAMNALKRTTGMNVHGGLDASFGPVDISTSFSFKSSDSQMNKFENMHENKTIFTQSQYHHIGWASVVNKIDLQLHPDFKAAVEKLLEYQTNSQLTQDIITDFFTAWGTHYAYAISFGTQGSGTYTFSEEQISKMVEQGVNYSKAWEADANVTIMGAKAIIGGGSNDESDKSMATKLAAIMQGSKAQYVCSGGASCSEGGVPQGEPQVPIFLDLRPNSELFGPPFYNDPLIVMELRDTMYDAIQEYAFVPLPEDNQTGIFELTIELGWDGDDAPFFTLNSGEVWVDVSGGGELIPKLSLESRSSHKLTGFALDWKTSASTALLLPHGKSVTLSGSIIIMDWYISPHDKWKNGAMDSESCRPSPPVEMPISTTLFQDIYPQAGQVYKLYGASTIVGAPPVQVQWDVRPTLTVKIKSADLKELLGITGQIPDDLASIKSGSNQK